MNAAEQIIIIHGGAASSIPANALFDDDAVTPLMDDDNATYLLDD